jgi:flagellar hook-associated protein 2
VSNYANDFQSVITRAVNIAQLPITALQNEESDTSSKEQLATGLQSALASLATTVTNLGNLGTNQGLTGSSSDTSVVEVDTTTATTPGSYAITNVTSLATTASVSTKNGYASASTTAVSTTGTMQLVINGQAVSPNIDLTGTGQNNLNGLAAAITALNAGVTASVINTGTGSTPNYLSISANSTGENTIQLFDDPAGANTQIALNSNAGSNANFDVQGQPVISARNAISNVIPGMTFTLTGTTGANQTVTLTNATDPTQISGQLENFVTQYNAVQTLLNAQIGSAAGLLTGNSMISGVEGALQSLLQYRGTGAIQSLTDLGVGMADNTGVISFNQSTAGGFPPLLTILQARRSRPPSHFSVRRPPDSANWPIISRSSAIPSMARSPVRKMNGRPTPPISTRISPI